MKRARLDVGLVIDGTDHFIRPIEAELRDRYQVDRFAARFVRLPLIGTRVNERLLDRQLQKFVDRHEVTFFEWAASLLVRITSLPKRGRMVTRLHSVELATAAQQVDWSKVDALIVVSNAMRRRLDDLIPQGLPPITVVRNGIDLRRYTPGERCFGFRLGMVCSLLPIKRVYEMVLCVHELRREGYPFTLDIAGSSVDPERRYAWALERLVKELALVDHVRFYGHVDDVACWLHNIDVFVSNSYWEGQQVALMEAMAAGCYCLGHCWDGIEEMLPSENIFATDRNLRSKLSDYAAWPEARRLEEQAQMRAIAEERFDQQRTVQEIADILEGISTA